MDRTGDSYSALLDAFGLRLTNGQGQGISKVRVCIVMVEMYYLLTISAGSHFISIIITTKISIKYPVGGELNQWVPRGRVQNRVIDGLVSCAQNIQVRKASCLLYYMY